MLSGLALFCDNAQTDENYILWNSCFHNTVHQIAKMKQPFPYLLFKSYSVKLGNSRSLQRNSDVNSW